MPSILEGVFSSSEDELNKMLVSLVGMPKDQIEAELSAIKSRVEEVAQTIPTKGNKGDKGDKGDQGIQGPKGEPGRDGRDGFIGKDGKQGIDGKDGKDGKDGVSIVDVNVAFDNHLVVTLSDGTEIDAGVIGSIGDNLQNVVANYVSNGANGTLIFKGLWNASTNTPTLSLSSSDAGAYYVVSVAGSTNLSGITDWQVNDWAIFNGTEWQKIDNSDLFNPSAVAITGGSINGTTIGATTASTGRFTSVTTPSVTASSTDLTLSAISTGAVKFNTLNGEQVRISDATVTGQYTSFSRNAGQNIQLIGAMGTANLGLYATGGGVIRFLTASDLTKEQFRVADTASAVNYVQVTGAATGANPIISVQGSDATRGLQFATKGTGAHLFYNNGGTNLQFRIDGSQSAVNYFQTQGSVTTQAVVNSAQGTDANISMAFQPKGTGAIDLAAGSSGVNISNGGTVTAITRTVAGTNYTSPPSVLISAPTTAGGVQATASTFLQLATTPTITSGGTGYTVNDVLTFVGGTIGLGANAAQVTVTSVSGGVITGISITTFGTGYSVVPTNPISVTGGTGSGATFTVTGWQVSGFTITNAGSGYIEQPTVTFSGGGGSGAAAYATVGGTTIVRGLGTNIDFYVPSSIASASPALRIADGGSSTIYPQINNFGSTVNILAAGATNTQLLLGSNGTSPITLSTNGASRVEQLRVSHTASAVNYVQVTGAATTLAPVISAQGSDANIQLQVQSKGTGLVRFATGSGLQAYISDTASPVNQLVLTGGATTVAPKLSVAGTDTNIDLSLITKGTGAVRLNTGGGEQFRATNTASAVNYVQVTGAATTANPTVSVQGSDANINMVFNSKGTGNIAFWSGSGSYRQFRISGANLSVNSLVVSGTTTGNAPSIASEGSDTNIDLTLTPKGTGVVQFGTHTANADVAISGYITIRDAGGTLRKLAVIT